MQKLPADRIYNHRKFYARRKELRNNSTHEERILWNYLKNSQLGFKFRRQQSIGGYIVDFYCPLKKLVLEIDGEYHSFQKESDHAREIFLLSLGITILRFSNISVRCHIHEILQTIKSFCHKLP